MKKLPENMRTKLKKPIGTLHKNITEIKPQLEKHITENKTIISIGDVTTHNLVKNNIYPQLCIIDNKIEREPTPNKLNHTKNIYQIKNPPGTITDELTNTIKKAIDIIKKDNNQKIIIIVEGEEDLAVIPCIKEASNETLLLYGQPKEGVVLVKAADRKESANNILKKLIKE